jgi:hypothetical protein
MYCGDLISPMFLRFKYFDLQLLNYCLVFLVAISAGDIALLQLTNYQERRRFARGRVWATHRARAGLVI